MFLSEVEDRFWISGRGCIIVPGIQGASARQTVKVGDMLRIVRPDGSQLTTPVAGIEMAFDAKRDAIPLLLSVTKDEVPIGSKVYHTANE